MIQSSLVGDIQRIVDCFLEQDQSVQLQTESSVLTDSVEGQVNPDAIQFDERPLWVRVQEKKNKLLSLEQDQVMQLQTEPSILTDSAEGQVNPDAIQSNETPLWMRIQEKKNKQLALENACREMDDELSELDLQYERINQLADQALNDAEQQQKEWKLNLQNLQRLKLEAESIQIDLEESDQRVEQLKEVQASNSRALSTIQMTHFIQENQAKKVLADLSKIESSQNEAREQLRAIDAIQTNVTAIQDELTSPFSGAFFKG